MRYKCTICGYIYDDDKEKVPFDQLPDTWKCPLCGARKADFAPLKEEKRKEVVKDEDFDEMENLTVGQLSALCSNLAKGCEKQYKFEEMAKFKELADYFAAITPSVECDRVDDIAAMLMKDIDENYPALDSAASSEADRGALRVRVWGEKVTRMLGSLVARYLEEGEDMLKDTQVWVCTICGFVYIGDEPPALCPVCKVPSWKFQRMEARA